MKEPANERLRHPHGEIDQRQQRIDPANKVTQDPNAETDRQGGHRDTARDRDAHRDPGATGQPPARPIPDPRSP